MDALMEKVLEGSEQRQADVDRLAEIDAEELSALVEPMQAVKKATAGVLKAREALLAREQKLAEPRIEEQNIRHRAAMERRGIEQRLHAGAIPDLDEFVSGVTGLWDTERHKWASTAPLDRHGEPTPARVRMEQIKDITARAEALYFESNNEVAEAELERLRVEVETPAGLSPLRGATRRT